MRSRWWLGQATLPRIRVFILLLIGLATISASEVFLISRGYADDTYYLVPDRFEISSHVGLSSFSINPTKDSGHEVNVVFKASYESVVKDLMRSRDGKLGGLVLVELPIEPLEFNFITDFIEDNPVVVRALRKQYFTNEIKVSLLFSADLTRDQISELFRFGAVLGALRGKVTCSSDMVHPICGKIIENIPVYNQHRLTMDLGDEDIHQQWVALNRFKDELYLGNKVKNETLEELDNAAESALFFEGQCKNDLSTEQLLVCHSIFALSEGEFSLTRALEKLAIKLFTSDSFFSPVPQGFTEEEHEKLVRELVLERQEYWKKFIHKPEQELEKSRAKVIEDLTLKTPFIKAKDGFKFLGNAFLVSSTTVAEIGLKTTGLAIGGTIIGTIATVETAIEIGKKTVYGAAAAVELGKSAATGLAQAVTVKELGKNAACGMVNGTMGAAKLGKNAAAGVVHGAATAGKKVFSGIRSIWSLGAQTK